MRTLTFPLLALLLIIGCVTNDDSSCDLSRPDREANANVACAVYSQGIVNGIEGRCAEQMVEAWGDQSLDEESLQRWMAWEDAATAQVQRDCVDYLMAASDFDGARYVVGGVCYYGYSPAHYDEWSVAACGDWVEDALGFTPTYPYTEYCPCLESGEWHTEGPDDKAECGAGHDLD